MILDWCLYTEKIYCDHTFTRIAFIISCMRNKCDISTLGQGEDALALFDT